MKKFIALVFALIFALSTLTVAFAATATTVDCSTCKQKFDSNAEYNAHLKDCKPATYKYNCEYCKEGFDNADAFNAHLGDKAENNCDVRYRSCKYGCGNSFDTKDELTAHQDVCPKYSETCEFCGEKFDSKAKKDAHECKLEEVSGGNKDVANIITKVIEAIKSIDWADLANKVVDFVKSINLDEIVGKVKPLFEKVTSLVGELEIPAAK